MSHTTTSVGSTPVTRSWPHSGSPFKEAIAIVDERAQGVSDDVELEKYEFAENMGKILQGLKDKKVELIQEYKLSAEQIVQLNDAHREGCKAFMRSTKTRIRSFSHKIDALIQSLELFNATNQDLYPHYRERCRTPLSVDAFVAFTMKYPGLSINDLARIAGEVSAARRPLSDLREWKDQISKFVINREEVLSNYDTVEIPEKTLPTVETSSQAATTDKCCSVFQRYKQAKLEQMKAMEQENALIRADIEKLQQLKDEMKEKHHSVMKRFRRDVYYCSLEDSVMYGEVCRVRILEQIKIGSDAIPTLPNEESKIHFRAANAKSQQIVGQIDDITRKIEKMAKKFKPKPGEGRCLMQ